MSGTTLAVALITLTAGLAFLAARVMLFRLPERTEPANRAIGDQDPEAAPDSATEDSQHDTQQTMPFPGLQTSASNTIEEVTAADDERKSASTHAHDSDAPDLEPEKDTGKARGNFTAQRTTSRAVGVPFTDDPPLVLFDRRLAQRVPFESNARLQWDDQDVAGTTIDLGMNGARCRLPGDPLSTAGPDVGTTVQVTLLLSGTLAVIQARVQWKHVDNDVPVIGLKFLRLQAPQQALLQAFILRADD